MSKYNWDLILIKKYVKESFNLSEVLRKLSIPIRGNNSKTLKNILINENIDFSHFTGKSSITKKTNNIDDYLTNKIYITSYKLKEKLLKEGLLEYKCDICGIKEWNYKPINLHLHHIDGNHTNNNLENLQLLCPNCHSQTHNYCNYEHKPKKINKCNICGKEISKGALHCVYCACSIRKKVKNRPTKEQLLQDYKTLKSFVKIGKKYNVSDNSIRHWFKYYNLPTNKKKLILYI